MPNEPGIRFTKRFLGFPFQKNAERYYASFFLTFSIHDQPFRTRHSLLAAIILDGGFGCQASGRLLKRPISFSPDCEDSNPVVAMVTPWIRKQGNSRLHGVTMATNSMGRREGGGAATALRGRSVIRRYRWMCRASPSVALPAKSVGGRLAIQLRKKLIGRFTSLR